MIGIGTPNSQRRIPRPMIYASDLHRGMSQKRNGSLASVIERVPYVFRAVP